MNHRYIPALARRSLAALVLALVFTLGFAQDTRSDLQKKFDATVERMEKAQADFMGTLRAEKDPAKRRALRDKRPGVEFMAEFKAIAIAGKGSDLAATCWMQVASIAADFGKDAEFKTAVDTLIADHVQSETIVELPSMLARAGDAIGADKIEPLLKDLLAKSPHKKVQAGALFELAQIALRPEETNKDKRAEGRKLFERLSKDYAGVKSPYGKDFKDMADGFLFELDHLQIGQVAPDFEVTDENGVKFKLSDYRGKVVVLDFWGFW